MRMTDDYTKGYRLARQGGPCFGADVTPGQQFAWLCSKPKPFREGFRAGVRDRKANEWNRRSDWDAC